MEENRPAKSESSANGRSPDNAVPTTSNENSPLLLSQASFSSYTESQNHFGDSRRGARRPFHYVPLIDGVHDSLPDSGSIAMYNRLKYYNRLCDPADVTLRIPDHMVPPIFFYGIPLVAPTGAGGKQSSLITIFVVWNTMVGTSLLSMPWAISQAGFTCGIVLMLMMALICFYTAYRILWIQKHVGNTQSNADFSHLADYLLGRWGSVASVLFSLSTLLGAAVVCWILCSNFLYYTVYFIYDAIVTAQSDVPDLRNDTHFSVICPVPVIPGTNDSLYMNDVDLYDVHEGTLFSKIWNLHRTVPLVMIVIIGPLVNIKSPDFFAKFSALGTLSVMFLIAFISAKAATWGFHLDFVDEQATDYAPHFKNTFFALTGTLSLSLFIHNCILSIMRNQRHPEKNGRDLGIAYLLVTMTYLFIGAVFYAAFPLAKSCIADNLLNNISGQDFLAFLARVFLFFQIISVCPLLYYIFRIQFMYNVFGSIYPGFKHVMALNTTLMTISVLFAMFLPSIGIIIRFSGAFSGLAYIFALPCLSYLAFLRQKGKLSSGSVIVHGIIILLGVANFIAQFVFI